MNLQYQIVNRCLQAVQDLEAPLVRKLQIEIELLQVKRLLLITSGRECGGVVTEGLCFETFEAAFTAACSSGVEGVSVQLMSLAKHLKSAVAVTSEPHRPGSAPLATVFDC